MDACGPEASQDTIAAIATAVGDAGIAIIRMSGPDAFSVADMLFVPGRGGAGAPHGLSSPAYVPGAGVPNGPESTSYHAVTSMASHTVAYGHLLDGPSGRVIDEVLLLKMVPPRTYTREPVVEIHCHGGRVVAQSVLRAVFGQGVRPAGPGEFTRRAFLNGRLDLAEAEAVMDLIRSQTDRGARAAVAQLEGRLSESIRAMREPLLDLLGRIAVNLDYPEYDAEETTLLQALQILADVRAQARRLLDTYAEGRILKEGLNLVIAGRPNAGKSSLMNRLAGQERSIVTDIPGTTRDVVETHVSLRGLPVRLMDTAGLRETEDAVERIGVARTMNALAQAELVTAVFDGAEPPSDEDGQLVRLLSESRVPVLYVVNKADVAHPEVEAALARLLPEKPLSVSARTGDGMEALVDRIAAVAVGNRQESESALVLTNERHRMQVAEAEARLAEAEMACRDGMTHDVVAFLAREAWVSLGAVLGEGATDELIDSIFSRFCLGK